MERIIKLIIGREEIPEEWLDKYIKHAKENGCRVYENTSGVTITRMETIILQEES